MKIVVSPAKSLDYKTKIPVERGTQPRFLDTTNKINKKLERLSKPKLGKLMDISDKLASLNYERYKNFESEHSKKNSRPAMYAFAGDVYVGLDPYTIPSNKIDRLQDTLRILSGMYGILRPLDIIQPYRLEMGTSIGIDRKKDLYAVWQKKITQSLNDELEEDEIFLNLASQEYFKSVNTKSLKVPVITPVFKDMNKGELKIVSFYAKKARGAMMRYIIDKNAMTVEDIKGFDYEGYGYSEKYSENKNELIFVR